jgi:hypothetical protein
VQDVEIELWHGVFRWAISVKGDFARYRHVRLASGLWKATSALGEFVCAARRR